MSGQTVTGSQAEVKDARGRRPGNRPRGEREGDPPTACLLTEASWPTLVGGTYRPSSLNPGISTYPSLKTYMLGGRSSPSRYLRATSLLISTSTRRSRCQHSRVLSLHLGRDSPKAPEDRKSTRLNSSHANISYAVFCLKKKKKKNT